jgi:hypothetical protein
MTKPTADPCEPYFIELYTAVGRALSAWSWVEESLSYIYTTAIFEQRTPAPAIGYAHASFWQIESFRGKLNVVDAAVKMRCRHLPETLKLWSVLYKRAREKNNKRNELAHGTVMNLGADAETYFIPSLAKTTLTDLASVPPLLPSTAVILWLGTNMHSNKLTAAEIDHRTQAFQMFKTRLDKFNGHLSEELPKITPPCSSRGVNR